MSASSVFGPSCPYNPAKELRIASALMTSVLER